MKYKKLLVSLAAATALMAWQAPAVAHNATADGEELKDMAAHSALIARGRVVKVEYKLSERTELDAPLPHVFVTYQLRDVIMGEIRDEILTLRFIGGPDGSGDFFGVSGVPLFEEGEEDLLFIRDNGTKTCPLVNCEWGRFRIHDGGVYNTHGSPVRAVLENNVIARGRPIKEFLEFNFPAPTFDGLMRNPVAQDLLKEMGMSMDEARKRYEEEAPKTLQIVTEPVVQVEALRTDTNEGGERPELKLDPRKLPQRELQREVPQQLKQQLPDRLQKPIQERLQGPVQERLQGPVQERLRDQLKDRPRLQAADPSEREIPEGPMSVEEFVERVKRASEGVRPTGVIVSVSPDEKFEPLPLPLAAATDHRQLDMPPPAKLTDEELKEQREAGDAEQPSKQRQ